MPHFRWCVLAALAGALAAHSTAGAQQSIRSPERAGVLHGGSHELAYVEWPGEGAPLVLLHGLGGNALWWAELAAALGGRHVIAIDLPGHGRSPGAVDWSLVTLAGSIARAVDDRWPGAHVWGGHSWGGKVALLAASTSRFDAGGLLLIDPVPVGEQSVEDYGALADYLFRGEFKTWHTLAEATIDIRKLPAYQRWSPPLERAFQRGLRADSSGAITSILTRDRAVDILKSIYEFDASHYVDDVTAPILLVTAEASREFQAQNVQIFSSATHVSVSGNHWLHVGNVDGLARILTSWLSTIP